MSPLANHRVIPAGWSAHHQPTAEATMNATCDVYTGEAGPAPWPLPAGWTGDGAPLATGVRCRVQALNQGNTALSGEQLQGVRTYLLTTPIDALPDLTVTDTGPVLIIHGGDDPHLDGVRLRVTDVQHGSYVFERDLVAVHNQTQD